MNRDELIAQVEAYAKRADLTQEIIDFFLPAAESRIGRDLKSFENEVEAVIAVTTNPFAVPDDYGQVRAIEVEAERGPRTLVSVDLQTINRGDKKGQPPDVYAIAGGFVHLRPFDENADVTFFYWSRPALPDPGSENDVLTRWPQVYLYGTLAELHIFERDDERAGSAAGLYQVEVDRINRDAGRASGAKPAMRLI